MSVRIEVFFIYVYMYWLYPICAGIHCATNTTIIGNDRQRNVTKSDYLSTKGQVYIKLLDDLFSFWRVHLKDLAIMTDDKGKDLAYAMTNKLRPGVQILFKEKKGQNISDLLSEMIYYTDTNNFIFIVSNHLYTDIVKQILLLNLDLPCRVWIFVSVEDIITPGICTYYSQGLNLYAINSITLNWIDHKAAYSSSVEECHIKEGKYSLHQTIQWDSEHGITNTDNVSRVPVKELYLRIVGIHEPPFQYKEGDSFTGYNMDILNYISRSVGFKYKVYECDQNLYGYLNETTKKWSGCVSDLVYGRADLITVALHLVSTRDAVIDYVLPWIGYSGITILAKQEQRQPFNFWAAFTPGLWIAIIATLVLSCVLLSLFGKVLSRCSISSDDLINTEILEYNTIKRAIWFLTSSCAFEGTSKAPKRHSIRLFIASIWIFIQILMAIFLGEAAAFLMSSGMKSEITSLEDLTKQHSVKYSCWRDSSIASHIFDMNNIEKYIDRRWTRLNLDNETFSSANYNIWTNPLRFRYTKLWERIVNTGFISSTSEALNKIKNGNFMFVSDSAVAEFLAGDSCDLKTIGRMISARPYGFAIRKFSSVKANISRALMELQHLSQMYEIRKRWWKKRNDCPSVGEDKGMNISEMVGLFYFLLFGLSVSMFILIYEKLRHQNVRTFVINGNNHVQ